MHCEAKNATSSFCCPVSKDSCEEGGEECRTVQEESCSQVEEQQCEVRQHKVKHFS